jgi:hypothetical protein
MLTLATLRDLQSPAGAALLYELGQADLTDENTLRLLTALRKAHPAPLAEAALETARLRARAIPKFGDAASAMFFTREALEQATDRRVSAARLAALGTAPETVIEFGCGIGGDTGTWAGAAQAVIAFELDPLRAAMARANVPAPHVAIIVADLQQALPLRSALPAYGPRFGFFDPARRQDDRRTFSIRGYVPPLESIRVWQRDAQVIDSFAIKLAPGVDYAELAEVLPGYMADGRLCFFSLAGELKEATLIIDGAHGPASREAYVISPDGSMHSLQRPVGGLAAGLPVRDPAGWLYEPDPAVIRAGLVQDLGYLLGAAQIDPTIAFLTADTAIASPLARRWPVIGWMPFNLKRLKAYLREHGIGRLTVKKRGSPITPEELHAKLKLDGGGEERVAVLTHVQGVHAVIICGLPAARQGP